MNVSAVQQYLEEVSRQFASGHAKEHAYRPALERLMRSFEDVVAVNDPKRSEHGNPDFIFLKASNQKIIRGYAEAKDITVSLDKTEKTNQMERYHGYANLFLTDYLEFRFFKNGEKYQTISLGTVKDGQLVLMPENNEELARELKAFLELPPESIKSGRRLAEIMGGKARRIRDNVSHYLAQRDEDKNSELEKIYQMMKELLVHDLSPDKFADMYAQTLVYGLFVARYGDTTPDSFTRNEARDLVPKSNPFLQHFFDHIVGPSFDTRLGYIVDELCEVFSVSDVLEIVHKHLRIQDDSHDAKDPIIHFYEDFLKEYDPAERKKMGAYYTPIPVVKFIVRQVDKILKEEFGIIQGLASDEVFTKEVEVGQDMRHDRRTKKKTTIRREFQRVQVLDPAVGTATFLNETIKFIHGSFKGQEGRWPSYVKENLIPRLHGFELMMAPYTIAHLKLGMTLKETGVGDLGGRLGIYLTNSLEEGVPLQQDIFNFGLAQAVSEESRLAAEVKNERPIMVVMGNPPYAVESSNKTKYADSLIDKYRVEPGGQQKLQERNSKMLGDDYVKFIAFAEDMIDKNGEGIVAMITNNGYLDNPTFRGMRWHLAKTFDKIYVLDLHGNSKKGEIAPDGSKDQNVFDIMQGVSIVLAVKTGKKPEGELAKVCHADSYGVRQAKFDGLGHDVDFTEISPDMRNVYFVPKNTKGEKQYLAGISVNKLFVKNTAGVKTSRDDFVIDTDKKKLALRITDYIGSNDTQDLIEKYSLKESSDWAVHESKRKLTSFNHERLVPISYRPFDSRWVYWDSNLVSRMRENIMKNLLKHNIVLVTPRQCVGDWKYALVSDSIGEHNLTGTAGRFGAGSFFPLYIYHEDGTRTPNFSSDDLSALTAQLTREPSPEDVIDYIYAILYSPNYREKYKEFLKIDFPRVPVPSQAEFDRLVPLGRELRELHLMKSPALDSNTTTYSISGDNLVEKVSYENSLVYINDVQYFGNVPEVTWNFYIGGYQPAQKWLKDRKGRALSNEDIVHYQKIIKVLIETDRIMKEIDTTGFMSKNDRGA